MGGGADFESQVGVGFAKQTQTLTYLSKQRMLNNFSSFASIFIFAGGVKVCLRYDGTPPPGGFDNVRHDARLDMWWFEDSVCLKI